MAQHRAQATTEKDKQIAEKVCHGIDPSVMPFGDRDRADPTAPKSSVR
jgi:hypothetical protein